MSDILAGDTLVTVSRMLEFLEKERQRSKVLVEALRYYEKPVFCGACMLNVERGETASEAIKKYEETGC